MRKNVNFGIQESINITNETIKGIVLDIGAVVTAGTVAAISSLNDIQVDLYLTRFKGQTQEIYSGYLDDVLTALYSQTPTYEIQKTAYGLGYRIKLDFLGGVIALKDGDVLQFKIKVATSAFTSLDTSKTETFINVETIPAVGYNTAIPVVKAFGIATGQINIDEVLGNNVVKIVSAMDFTAPYTSSTKSKLQDITVTAMDYERSVSREVLETENRFYFDDNPESEINQLVCYWEDTAIHGVRLKGKLDKAASADAKILVVRSVVI
ncbi:structural protein [Cellulophaga phage phi48:2]|uniref:structural protein n=1 Tax=Cellulophaga phage phi48:2 TaxID=1327968 RepID=UPI000351A567|nr:structural protein [Cellulophaga phage phi48:2]AGO47258.1 structural protein [Cellulophaga phage phi48:2]